MNKEELNELAKELTKIYIDNQKAQNIVRQTEEKLKEYGMGVEDIKEKLNFEIENEILSEVFQRFLEGERIKNIKLKDVRYSYSYLRKMATESRHALVAIFRRELNKGEK